MLQVEEGKLQASIWRTPLAMTDRVEVRFIVNCSAFWREVLWGGTYLINEQMPPGGGSEGAIPVESSL